MHLLTAQNITRMTIVVFGGENTEIVRVNGF